MGLETVAAQYPGTVAAARFITGAMSARDLSGAWSAGSNIYGSLILSGNLTGAVKAGVDMAGGVSVAGSITGGSIIAGHDISGAISVGNNVGSTIFAANDLSGAITIGGALFGTIEAGRDIGTSGAALTSAPAFITITGYIGETGAIIAGRDILGGPTAGALCWRSIPWAARRSRCSMP